MNRYETIFILSSETKEEQRKEVSEKVKNYISSNGKITKFEELGLKKLAYEVKNCKQGYYYVIEFESHEEAICQLERLYRITDEVIKFITIKKSED